MNTTEIEEKLLIFPENIKTVQNLLIDAHELQASIIKRMDEIDINIKSIVYSDPELKNDTLRKARWDSALKGNIRYSELGKKLEVIKQDIAAKNINLEYQKNMFRASLAIAGMMKP